MFLIRSSFRDQRFVAMPCCAAALGYASDTDRRVLEAFVRPHSAPQAFATCAQIVLLAPAGAGVRATVAKLAVGRATVRH